MCSSDLAGLCTITWRVPGGNVTTTSTWTRIGAGRSKTFAGPTSSNIAIRAGRTTTIAFHNTYTATDITLTRQLVVYTPCTVTATPRPVGLAGQYIALLAVTAPAGCTPPKPEVTCLTARSGTAPRGDQGTPCSWSFHGGTLRITSPATPQRITITLTSHPKGLPAKTRTTTYTLTTPTKRTWTTRTWMGL